MTLMILSRGSLAPRVGVPEDPVTGSAHCALAPYWSSRLGRNELTGHQISVRGGVVRTKLDGDRVLLSGKAVSMYVATLTDAARRQSETGA